MADPGHGGPYSAVVRLRLLKLPNKKTGWPLADTDAFVQAAELLEMLHILEAQTLRLAQTYFERRQRTTRFVGWLERVHFELVSSSDHAGHFSCISIGRGYLMNKKEFLTAVEEMLEADAGSLQGDESLDALPWDSLAVVSFIALADEHLDAAVSPQELSQAKTLEDVLALVAEKFD